MGTNKDQAQAQAFMLQRVVSALTVHETDPETPPFRRPLMAALAGIAVGVLVLAGFWVYGLIVPGGDRFAATDVIAVEKETGARYVLINGRLHPVVNYTSALLALDKHADVRVVPRATLAGIPVGAPIGIPDAPDSLPARDSLLTGDWSMCDRSVVDTSGKRTDEPVLLVGQQPVRGHGVQSVLVHAGDHAYVVSGGYRHELAPGADVALELGKESFVTVGGTWLDTVPAGKPIGPVALGDAGRPSGAVPGMTLVSGQLLQVEDGNAVLDKQFYLVAGDQLVPVSPLRAAVQRVLGQFADPPVVVNTRALVGAHRATPPKPTADDPPWTRPRFAAVTDPDATVCARFRPGAAVPTLLVDATLPSSVLAAPDGPVRVAVPAGRAALVEVMSTVDEQPGQGTVALVTDQGRLHPLDDPRHVSQVLGYQGVSPVRITSVLADRVPRGRSLSPAAARVPVS